MAETVTTVRREYVYTTGHGHTTTVTPQIKDEFKDGQLYIFRGLMDNYCIDLHRNEVKDGQKIHTHPDTRLSAQVWRARVDSSLNPPRGFRIESSTSKDTPYVLHAQDSSQNHAIVLKAFNGDRGQFWNLVKVPGTERFQILNPGYGKGLSDNGKDYNCRAVEADFNDLHQQWNVELKK